MESALALRDVRKTFGKTVAVDGMNLVVPRGALYGVIGPNGAGKTTCIRGLREAIVSARIRAQDLDRSQVEAVMRFRRPASVTVTAGDERRTNVGFNRALPFAFAGLLVFGIMIGGQTLLTSTIEEKSSRSWPGRSLARWP